MICYLLILFKRIFNPIYSSRSHLHVKMDLTQTKLSKSEWASVEVPVSENEQQVIKMIMNGFNNPDICENFTATLASVMKIVINDEFEYYLYTEYFAEKIRALCTIAKHPILNEWNSKITKCKAKLPNKADVIRMNNTRASIQQRGNTIFEYVMLDFCAGLLDNANVTVKPHTPAYYLYSLTQFMQISVFKKTNRYVREFVELVVQTAANPAGLIREVFIHASECIEKNPYLIQFEDHMLYPHQRTLFRALKDTPHIAKLVLYMAPTGTGKTLSPIGLSQTYRVIFVCVARHVGLALAKSAISVGKCVAFAFGCETASDIRLHYFAAKDYKINKKSGGIGRVDNSNGTKVEIMICDVASYITAMHYMLAFNDVSQIVTFWDEPTITMDKPDNELHASIHRNWCENMIPKMVLSCATLPKLSEIGQTLNDFKCRFATVDEETGEEYEPEIITIDSYECKKTITLLSKEGKCVLPHLLFSNYRDIVNCVEHCKSNKTLLRYFDVNEIVRFILYLESISQLPIPIHVQFLHVHSITMTSLKQYYLAVLDAVSPAMWEKIHDEMVRTLPAYFPSLPDGNPVRKTRSTDTSRPATIPKGGGEPLRRSASVNVGAEPVQDDNRILILTRDAHTLTDGPTIFLAEDVIKIGRFYIQTANIPPAVLSQIVTKIEQNNLLQDKIDEMERELADKTGEKGEAKQDKEHRRKAEREPQNNDTKRRMEQIELLREKISTVTLNPMYVPNTKPHQGVWLPSGASPVTNAFVPTIGETDVRDIMQTNVDNERKLLLLLGIGVFEQNTDTKYAEVMKRMAYEQRLFMIIASSDYIYGTNYQFCHGFIGKDLDGMTQQKTIQAIGRIGRNNIQNEYTVRFRDNSLLKQLYQRIENNVEAAVMSRLFCSERDEDEDEYVMA
jgi:hypothetical protein